MPEPDAPANEEPVETPAEELEGTTPQEVAKILNLPVDDEEGNDPDAEEVPAAPKADEPEAPAEDEDAEEEEPAKVEPAKLAEPVASDDADDKYSFEVTDAEGVTFKITAGAKMEDVLAEFNPKNNGQILDILNQLQKLEGKKASDEADAEQEKTSEERRTRASELYNSWQEEAKVLQGDKRIPEGDDGEKRINAVYKFMADENEARMKAGKPTLNSFEDALDKLENKEARDKVVADAKAAKDKARENGAKVGGSSAPASSGTPLYKAGTARNANDAIRSMGLLD